MKIVVAGENSVFFSFVPSNNFVATEKDTVVNLDRAVYNYTMKIPFGQ